LSPLLSAGGGGLTLLAELVLFPPPADEEVVGSCEEEVPVVVVDAVVDDVVDGVDVVNVALDVVAAALLTLRTLSRLEKAGSFCISACRCW